MSVVSICGDIDELVTRHAYGSKLSQKERSRVEEHLKGCASCSDLVFFVQKTMALARKEPIRFEPPTEPCLATETFIALDEGTLDEEAGHKAKLHLLACPPCRQVFLKLRSLSEQRVEERILTGDPELEAEIEDGMRDWHIRTGANIASAAKSAAQNWGQMLERAKLWILDLNEKYGAGTMLGPMRILSEQLAAPTGRGGTRRKRVAKVLEVPVGNNTYSVELSILPDEELLAVDIAGKKILEKFHLFAALRLETGERLHSARTNPHGNTHFTVPREAIGNIGVLDLHGEVAEAQIAFRMPHHP
jgi:uncharacterized protein YbaR (Trm112 family)